MYYYIYFIVFFFKYYKVFNTIILINENQNDLGTLIYIC